MVLGTQPQLKTLLLRQGVNRVVNYYAFAQNSFEKWVKILGQSLMQWKGMDCDWLESRTGPRGSVRQHMASACLQLGIKAQY